MALATPVFVAALGGGLAYLYGSATQQLVTRMGVLRQLTSTPLSSPDDLVVIQDTTHCEDLHYWAPSNTIFTACEDLNTTRAAWFPGLGTFNDASVAWSAKGSIHTIDPETMESRRLAFENFDLPFVTHGIDVIADPEKPETALYIFAVNHLPNDEVFPKEAPKEAPKEDGPTAQQKLTDGPEARSQIELFHHVIGSDSVKHVRSIIHPQVTTPNDIFAVGPSEFYVTNDHHYRGGLMRDVEDIWPGATWSNIVHVSVTDATKSEGSAQARSVLDKMHNPNGLGHGRTPEELLLGSATGGEMFLCKTSGEAEGFKVEVVKSILLDSTIDNPSYYRDPYPETGGGDASGFVLAGLTKAINVAKTQMSAEAVTGVMVWYVKPSVATEQEEGTGSAGTAEGWEKKLLYQDDGSNIRDASCAVLVPIDPKREDGKKKAWLFISGFSSHNAVAVKVDL